MYNSYHIDSHGVQLWKSTSDVSPTTLPSDSLSLTLTPHRYSVRVSPQMANRIVDSARSILNKFIPDIYIYTDHMKGANSGKYVPPRLDCMSFIALTSRGSQSQSEHQQSFDFKCQIDHLLCLKKHLTSGQAFIEIADCIADNTHIIIITQNKQMF